MTCSSVKLWKGTVVAGYGTGQIRLYEAVTGILHAEVSAHARWIYSLDIAPFSGMVSYVNRYKKDMFSSITSLFGIFLSCYLMYEDLLVCFSFCLPVRTL